VRVGLGICEVVGIMNKVPRTSMQNLWPGLASAGCPAGWQTSVVTSQTITAAAAGTWMLGDLAVNRMGFGAMRLTANADGTPTDRERAIGVLRRAVELGVNHIDTAAFYFSPLRSANELINRALAPYPDDLVITTKVWPGRDPSGEWVWAAPGQLRGQVEENLRLLGRDHLDVVNLRLPRSQATASIAEHFGVLASLRDAGLIRHLGISNARPEHLAEALAIAPVVCVQNVYGIGASADKRDFLRSCGEQGVAFVPFFAIAGAAAILYLLAVALLLVLLGSLFGDLSAQAHDPNATSALTLILFIWIVAILSDAPGANFYWLGVLVLAAAALPIIFTVVVTLWAAMQPSVQEQAA